MCSQIMTLTTIGDRRRIEIGLIHTLCDLVASVFLSAVCWWHKNGRKCVDGILIQHLIQRLGGQTKMLCFGMRPRVSTCISDQPISLIASSSQSQMAVPFFFHRSIVKRTAYSALNSDQRSGNEVGEMLVFLRRTFQRVSSNIPPLVLRNF